MWQVDNQTPFAAGGCFARDQQGFEHWVLIVRATFNIEADGRITLDENQEPPQLAPRYTSDEHNDYEFEPDVAPFRPNTDITVHGAVTAPDNAFFKSLPFSVRVGSMRKDGIAFGHRRIVRHNNTWHVERYDPVEEVALSWRNSLGGNDAFDLERSCPLNPIGMGWSADFGRAGHGFALDLPHIESARNRIGSLDKLPEPIGFGAIPPAWQPRIGFTGTYDAEWEKSRAPLPPHDFSNKFYQAAPSDQILALNGGEAVEIIGLHPEGHYSFSLPQILIVTKTIVNAQKPVHRLRLTGVHIHATVKRLNMVWNCSIPCNGIDHTVMLSTVRVKQVAGVYK